MILLLGGTSETAGLAEALASANLRVLVSTVTDLPLNIGSHPAIERVTGALDARGLEGLVRRLGIKAIVDATHPYAVRAHETARRVADKLRLPYFKWSREETHYDADAVIVAIDHERAAELAASYGRAVLLTTGSKHLRMYVESCRNRGIPLAARVLPEPESIEACRAAGIEPEHIVTGRGPFSVEENVSVLRKFDIGVLVTKDSGPTGGTPEKLEAARQCGCRVIMIRRPMGEHGAAFSEVEPLVRAVCAAVSAG
ncbi:MAG: precorrin-6A reductase [Thermodesulfobacteriota bacterium]